MNVVVMNMERRPTGTPQVNHDVVIDTSEDPPVHVTRIYTTLDDGAYGVGQKIPVTVVFSAPVSHMYGVFFRSVYGKPKSAQ